MGITRELVRSVLSRNRSVGTHESYNTTRSTGGGDKKRWISVRSYLCGEEFNSVLAEEDSASVKSSEATVTQPVVEDSANKGDINGEDVYKEKYNSTSSLFRQEDAAIIIQAAFRDFLARRQSEEIKDMGDKKEFVIAMESTPSRDSIGTSIEVQTGNSLEVLSVAEENVSVHNRMTKKARTQVLKIKEDWDDSTVSSNISKMRIQNRLEATNRRQKALAYAFAQQLRICSKRKQTRSDGTEPNMGWSWLERWMATRIPEYSVESRTSKQFEAISSNHRVVAARKRFFDVGEEKESCGSNEVSLQFDSISMASANHSGGLKTSRNRIKSTRTISRRKTAASYHCPKEHSKVIKK